MNKALLGCSHTFSLTHCPGLFPHCNGGAKWVWQTLHTWQSLSYLPCGSLLGKKKKFGDPCLGQSLSWECVWVHMWQTHRVGGSARVWVRRLQELVPRFLGTSELSFGHATGVREASGRELGGVFPGRVRRVVQEGCRVLVMEEAGGVNEDGLSGWKGRTSGGLGVSRQWAALVRGRVRENTEGYSLVIYI